MDLDDRTDPSCVVNHRHIHAGKSSLRPIMWGLLVGAIQAASPVALRWLEPATLHALYIAFIAAVYIGFAVADGRPRVIAVESSVAAAFLILAAVGVTGSAWLLVAGYGAHGVKDLWQHRTQFVDGTRWWPPFCATIDFLVAVILAAGVTYGVSSTDPRDRRAALCRHPATVRPQEMTPLSKSPEAVD